MRLDELNALDPAEAERELLRCCGSSRWAREMTAARPFGSVEAAGRLSDVIWAALDRADWLEAFAAHPRIGEPGRGPAATAWAAQEQSGVTAESRADWERLNRTYEARFGYLFIVCAAGKSGGEMRAMLETRLANDPAVELRTAAEEQRRIARLRLARLIT